MDHERDDEIVPQDVPHHVSAERLKRAAEALIGLAEAYLLTPTSDVSALERAGLHKAERLAELALEALENDDTEFQDPQLDE
jgi:hypothetical protein